MCARSRSLFDGYYKPSLKFKPQTQVFSNRVTLLSKEIKNLKIAFLVSGLLLCFAVIPAWPYGYYTFLRIVICLNTVYGAFIVREKKILGKHFVPLVLIAILFNPFYPVFLSRWIWVIIDLVLAVYFLQISKKMVVD